MFETTIEKDMETASTDAELESLATKIYNKFRSEFLEFIEELKKSGIAQALYNSSTPEETVSLWAKYSSENEDFFARVKTWAERRDEYFDTLEFFPMFDKDEELDCILEIGLMIFIVKDECLLSEEDIDPDEDFNSKFGEQLTELLKKSSNRILKAAGWYIYYTGSFDTMTEGNIFDFCPIN